MDLNSDVSEACGKREVVTRLAQSARRESLGGPDNGEILNGSRFPGNLCIKRGRWVSL